MSPHPCCPYPLLATHKRHLQSSLDPPHLSHHSCRTSTDRDKTLRIRYMQSISYAAEGGTAEGEDGTELPSRAEDVDKFMQELAAAAGGSKIAPVQE